MARVQTQKRIGIEQFHFHAGVTNLQIEGQPETTQNKTLITDDLTQAELEAAVTSYTFDPDHLPPGSSKDWRDRLKAEILFIEDQLSTWPANASTNQEALQRINFLLAASKRLARNQSRILKFIDNSTLDSE